MTTVLLPGVVLAPAPTPPGPPPMPPSPWEGVQMVWRGADGSTWDLLSDTSQVLLRAIRGLHMPQFERYTSTATGTPGTRHRGSRAQEREVILTVEVSSTLGTDDWLSVDSAWWDSVDVDTPGELAVTVRGRTRRISLRLVEAPDNFPDDPTMTGQQVYQLSMAGEAYWRGDVITRPFTAGAPIEFYAADPAVLGITSSSTLGSAVMPNPGEAPAWPLWTVQGPVSTVSVGVAGAIVSVDAALSASETMLIDSAPGRRTILMADGTDRINDVTDAAWAPVPRGSSVPLELAATGTSTGFNIACSITPLYRRAWGTR